MSEVERKKVYGGPDRKSFDNGNVIPALFNKEDPYWDTPAALNSIDKLCKSGKMKDLIIIYRTEEGVFAYYRGLGTEIVVLGMLEFTKRLINN